MTDNVLTYMNMSLCVNWFLVTVTDEEVETFPLSMSWSR